MLEKDPTPTTIRYLVLASAFTCLFTGLSFFLPQVGTSTQEELFYRQAMTGFTMLSVLTMVEWFFLRRSRKLIGPYGLAFALEIIKYFLFGLATADYIETVPNVSASPFLLHQLLSLGIIFSLALTKIARARIEQLAQKDLSRNLLNLLPTLLIIVLFLGTYVTEIVGLGVPRQRSEFPEEYEKKDILWELYNTPSWDATYLLENLLDQFTAGLQFPDEPLFNVTPKDPTYWRLSSLEKYEYTGKSPYTTDWNPVDQVGRRVLTPTPEGTPFSSIVPGNENPVEYMVDLPLDHSDSTADVTVNPSFTNVLPTTWNGKYGSYIDSASFTLKNANGANVGTSVAQTRELFPQYYTSTEFPDLLGIDANIQVETQSEEEGKLTYTMNYKDLSSTILNAMIFSMTPDNYSDILDSSTWNDIQDLYLQLPNTAAGTMPDQIYVDSEGGMTTPTFGNYTDWAPTVVGLTEGCVTEGQTVFSQAYADMARFTPIGYIFDGSQVQLSQGTGCELNLWFDMDMWLGTQIQANPLYEMPHPEEYEDYNEWFLRNEGGVSLHYASTLTTVLRLRGIPSRVVVGYIAGNDTMHPTKRVVTARFLHAWTEVLVPINPTPIPGDEYLEWVSFDPLLTFLASVYNLDIIPGDIPTVTPLNKTLMINPNYDWNNGLGLIGATAYESANPDDPVIERCITDDIDRILHHDDPVSVSVRFMVWTNPYSWFPWQPTCEYAGTEVSFYIGRADENGTGGLIEDRGTFLGSSSINSSGMASIDIIYDMDAYGIQDLYFYAVFKVTEVCTGQLIRKAARSLKYSISLF